jgi:hypothetical protein
VNATHLGAALASLTGERVRISASSPEAFLFVRDNTAAPDDPTVVLIAPLRRF